MKNTFYLSSLTFLLFFSFTISSFSQSEKRPVYAEVGIGFGQTLFFGDIQDELAASLGGDFDPQIGNNLSMGFYLSPEKWKGFGIGSRIHGTFGTPIKGKNTTDEFVFNYYNLSIASKYYFVSREFNKGFYINGSVGFGQMTAKRLNENAQDYSHQYAIGTSFMGGLGYTYPFKKSALGLEVQFEYANRNGTVTGRKDGVGFTSGQIGANLIWSF